MTIADAPFRWEEGRGYAFDDTLEHDAWNNTGEPRWVIFADVPRDLGWAYSHLNTAMYQLIQRSKHVQALTARLAADGVRID